MNKNEDFIPFFMSQTPGTKDEIRGANLLLFILHLCFVSGIRTFHYRFRGIISRHKRLSKLSSS